MSVTQRGKQLGVRAALTGWLLLCCSDDHATHVPLAMGEDAGAASPPPSTHCVLDLDCAAMQHCDLGLCVQACSSDGSCGVGESCSVRGRCLPPNVSEEIRPAAAVERGQVSVEPLSLQLDATATEFALELASTAADEVRYRIETSGSYLVPKAPRGEFTGTTRLEFGLQRDLLTAPDTAGRIRIFTDLGSLSVNTSVHRGLSGYYRGILRYDVGRGALGDTQLAVEIHEDGDGVVVRIDPDASTLFPRVGGTSAAEGMAVVGRGSFADGRLQLRVVQAVDPSVGAHNVLRRAVIRVLNINLQERPSGVLEGAFSEDIQGLTEPSMRLEGAVTLNLVPRHAAGPANVSAALPNPPAVGRSFLTPQDVFGWAETAGSCPNIIRAACGLLQPTDQGPCQSDPAGSADLLVAALAGDLVRDRDDASRAELLGACETSLGLASLEEYLDTSTAHLCGLTVPLGCLLQTLSQTAGDKTTLGRRVSTVVSRFAEPPLLVAKQKLVEAALDSFGVGTTVAASKYEAALDALHPHLMWLMQPPVLQTLHDLPVSSAEQSSDARLEPFSAGRALVDMVATAGALEAERIRAMHGAAAAAPGEILRQLQQSALVAHLEAAAVLGALQNWTAPDSLLTPLAGAHASFERAFTAIAEGPAPLGLPSGFVPFLYRPEDAANRPTNFEQVLADATRTVGDARTAIDALQANDRAFEQNQDSLRVELLNMRSQYDASLRDICGSDFDAGSAAPLEASCGSGDTGSLASLRVGHRLASQHLSSQLSQIDFKVFQIAVSVQAMLTVYGLRAAEINFVSETGHAINALTYAQSILSNVQEVLSVASHGNLLNGFSSVGLSVVTGIIGGIKASLELSRNELALLQTLHAQQTAATIEQINAFAGIQRELTEVAQLRVELFEGQLRAEQAWIDAQTTLGRARELLALRAEAVDAMERDSARNPTFRLLRDRYGLRALRTREEAQRALYLAARALQYEINTSVPDLEEAVSGATTAEGLEALASCMRDIFSQYRLTYGSPQEYVTRVSVRSLLGIEGDRMDEVTRQALTAGEQFRQVLLQNDNLDGRGGARLRFATTLLPNNGLWSDAVCNDRISTLQAQLVGDFLGDNRAEVDLQVGGTSLMRTCDSGDVRAWALGGRGSDVLAGVAVLQAGTNTFGDAPPNGSLFGQSVARATWELVIPGAAAAPSNADVDLEKLEDVVLEIAHRAAPRRTARAGFDFSCVGYRQ